MKKQVLFIIMMLMPLMASASTNINGIYYNLNSTNKVAEVTYVPSGTAKYSGSIVIPKTVAYGGVTYSVTSIEDIAFSDCSDLTSITIPNSVTSIGNDAFSGCLGLNTVHITDLAAWCDIDFSYLIGFWDPIPSNPLIYADHLYLNGVEVKDLVIPNGVTKINEGAFYGCKGLTSVTIPNSVTFIGERAFYGCNSLITIQVDNGNTIYDSRNNCNAIIKTADNLLIAGCKNTVIPYGVASIGYSAFEGCWGLTSIDIPNSVTSIGDYAFSGSGLTSVTIPNGVTSIGEYAFSGCSDLTSVTIPSSVAFIGCGVFSRCSRLNAVHITDIAAWCNIESSEPSPYESDINSNHPLSYAGHLYLNGVEVKDLVIPSGVTKINEGSFYGCKSLTSVTIPNSVTSIGASAFSGCSDISTITIGNGIKSIGSMAFANYNNLIDVYCLAEEVPTTSSDVFENSFVKYATLHVPESSLNLYKRSEPWIQFGTFVGIPKENNENKCAKPTITLLANGKIKVESATEGATCVTNISASNANPLTDGEISLSIPLIVYTVTAYATAEGYDDSEVATATFRFEGNKGDVDGDGKIDISDLTQLVNIILGQ